MRRSKKPRLTLPARRATGAESRTERLANRLLGVITGLARRRQGSRARAVPGGDGFVGVVAPPATDL
jgi:hypothetical protein